MKRNILLIIFTNCLILLGIGLPLSFQSANAVSNTPKPTATEKDIKQKQINDELIYQEEQSLRLNELNDLYLQLRKQNNVQNNGARLERKIFNEIHHGQWNNGFQRRNQKIRKSGRKKHIRCQI